MAPTDHNFRYLLKPGTDFGFVAKFRTWLIVSVLLTTISIGSLFVNKAVRGSYLNWTIDFRGGTEVIYAFRSKADPKKFVQPDAAKVRAALDDAKVDGYYTLMEEKGPLFAGAPPFPFHAQLREVSPVNLAVAGEVGP